MTDRVTTVDISAQGNMIKYQALTSSALSGILKVHRARDQPDVNGHRGLSLHVCAHGLWKQFPPGKDSWLLKVIFKEKTLPRMEVILFSVSSVRYEGSVQSLLLLGRTWWLEVLETQILNHFIVHLQTLHLNRSPLSIITVIPQSHFLAMTLKIMYFTRCFCHLCLPHLSRRQGAPRTSIQVPATEQ